jgi:bis(5'-adenosyl)-triphosphatase
MKCPFCDKNIQDSCFFEGNGFLAIYNIAPVLPGHSLIIPRRHIKSIFELNEEELYHMVSFSRKVISVLKTAFNTGAFDWTIQEGKEAGQTIEHLHMHIMPRITGDLPDPGDWYPKLKDNVNEYLDSDKRRKLTNTEMQRIIGKLKKVNP